MEQQTFSSWNNGIMNTLYLFSPEIRLLSNLKLLLMTEIEDITGRAEIRNFSSSVEKYFTSERSERVRYVSTLEEKFRISKRPCNVLFIIQTPMKYQTILLK